MFRRETLKFGVGLVAVGFVTAIVMVISQAVNVKAAVEQSGRQGVAELRSGLAALGQSQIPLAERHFTAAGERFAAARRSLKDLPPLTERAPYIGGNLLVTERLLRDAERFAQVGLRLTALLPDDRQPQPAVTITDNGIIQGSVGMLSEFLAQREEFLAIVNETVSIAHDLVELPTADVPGAVRSQVRDWQRLLNGFVGSGDQLQHLTDVLIGLFAPATPQEYLIVFQNNDELRATGGFLGTYLLVKIDAGTFKILDAPGNGPYALSDEVAKVNMPPQPVTSIVKFWTFHDANWFLDVPTSASTMLDFYAQDRGFRPDGILFITPGVMEDLLTITGPVRPANYQVDITAENFVDATEQQVEFGYDKAKNNPKQFLIDLVPLMLEKISQLNSPDALRALAMVLKRANQNDLLLYSRHDALQSSIVQLGWDGSLPSVEGDSLAVVDSNLGGGKTDRVIEEDVVTTVTVDGNVLRHEVAVTRTHRGKENDLLHGSTNKDFIRVYAPADAAYVGVSGATVPGPDYFLTPDPAARISPQLQAAEGQTLVDDANGIRITHESGRLVIGAWSRIAPGEKQTVTFTYTTPAPTGEGERLWRFYWHHQPGAPIRDWQVVFKLPENQRIIEASASGKVSGNNRTAEFNTDSTTSRTFSVRYR